MIYQLLSRSFSSSTVMASRNLNGKVAIVTASTDGIGYSIAKRLAQDGAKVVISSRKETNVTKALEALDKEGLSTKVSGIQCHVGNPEHRRTLLEYTLNTFSSIDILVSNAAVNPSFGSILDVDEASWDKIFDINVKSAFLLTKEIAPIMKKKQSGSIIFVSSIGGYVPIPMIGAYSVSKTALLSLTKALSNELAPNNVRVNCIAPGIVKTNFSSALTTSDLISEKILEQVPLGRFAHPDEMGGIASFLASEDASYITGETILVTGGTSARL